MNGRISAILKGRAAGVEMEAVPSAVLDAGRGLAGDRYYKETGTFSKKLQGKPDKEVTLIESEEIAAFNSNALLDYPNTVFRRNIVTTGIRLNALVGKEFMLGKARLKGIRLCEPCSYLAGLLGPEVLRLVVHKCGLRAQVLDSGEIAVGQTVALVDPAIG